MKQGFYPSVPDILRWHDTTVSRDIASAYKDTVCDALGVFLATCKRQAPQLYDSVSNALDLLDEPEFDRLLLAPETTHKLFYRRSELISTASFLVGAAEAEALRAGKTICPDVGRSWTALGDYLHARQKRGETVVHRSWVVRDAIPVDFLSPFSRKISLNEDEYGEIDPELSEQEIATYDAPEMGRILQFIDRAADSIHSACPVAWDSTVIGTRVLVVRTNPLDPLSFASSTSGNYTGRSMLVNPHNTDAQLCTIADAIVHESIHGILYMAERMEPWVRDEDVFFSREALIESPWTGRRLLLRAFMQACFVWHGLRMMWRRPACADVFGAESRKFLDRAESGFAEVSLVDRLGPWKPHINPSILAAIAAMQG
jgi:HEXXH motif-containing protein